MQNTTTKPAPRYLREFGLTAYRSIRIRPAAHAQRHHQHELVIEGTDESDREVGVSIASGNRHKLEALCRRKGLKTTQAA